MTQIKSRKSLSILGLVLSFGLAASVSEAAPSKGMSDLKLKTVILKVEPINSDVTEAELLKKQEARANAVNHALDQALKEQAKSRSDLERTQARMAAREARVAQDSRSADTRLDLGSRETRSQLHRELREERQRERRLNWLND